MNFKELVKTYWKTAAIVLLSLMFVSKCTSSGNYKRKYNKQVKQTEYVIDSMSNVYSNSSRYIDSLKNVIVLKNNEIDALNKQLDIYKEQNKALANKPVVVTVKKDKEEK